MLEKCALLSHKTLLMFEAILKITDKFQGYRKGQQGVLKSSKRLLTNFEVIGDVGEI